MKNYITKIVTFAILITTLISCKVSKDIETPKDAFPENFRNASVSSDTTSIADVEWKNFFTEKDIIKLIDSAVARNNDLQIAEKNIEIAQYRFTQSKWGNVPQVNLFVNASTSNPSDNSFTGKNLGQALGQNHIDDYSAGATLSWEADIWGKLSSAKRASYANLLQTDAAKRAVQTQLIANIANAYYNLIALDKQLKITLETVKIRANNVETMKALKEGALVNGAAVVQSEANLYAAEVTVPDLKRSIRETENALNVLLARVPGTILRSDLDSQMPYSDLKTGVSAQLLKNRPDVQAAELSFRAAFSSRSRVKKSLAVSPVSDLKTR